MTLYSNLKIAKSENKRAFYIIHKLSTCIKSKELSYYWLNETLNRLDKDDSAYTSTYRFVVGNDATVKDKKFADDIDRIFKNHII